MLNNRRRIVTEDEKKYVAYKLFTYREMTLKFI